MFKRKLAIICGVYLASLFCYSSPWFLLLIAISIGVVYQIKKITLKMALLAFALMLTAVLVATNFQTNRAAQIKSVSKSRGKEVTVRIVSDVSSREDRSGFAGQYQGKKFRVTFKGGKKLEYGDVLTAGKAKVYPLKLSRNFNIKNYDDYLYLHGYCGKIVLNQRQLKEIQKEKHSLIRAVFRYKNRLVSIHKNTMSIKDANLLGSIIFGTSASPLAREVQEKYKRAGIIHLLVVSGSQIAIMVGLALYLAGWLRLRGWREFLFVSLFNVMFTVATGGGYSIVRAAIMAEITISAKLFKRNKDFYNTLFLSGVILTIGNPQAIFDIGYQLSFVATFSLIYLEPLIQERLERFMPKVLSVLVAVSVAPLLMTMPLILFHFNAIALFALPVNILIAPWVETLVVSGFVAMVLGLFWIPLALAVNSFNSLLISLLNILVNFTDSFSFSYIYVPQISLNTMLLLFVGAILLREYLHSAAKGYLKAMLALLILLTIINVSVEDNLILTFLDVGQGDSILIETAQGETVLIDAGSTDVFNLSGSVLYPTLIKKGIKKIDYLVVTHPHYDHYSAVEDLIDRVSINNIILYQGEKHGGVRYKRLLKKCRLADVTMHHPEDILVMDELK